MKLKNKFWLIFYFSLITFFNVESQIPNNDFENWHWPSLWYQEPDNWKTNNTQLACWEVTKDTFAYHGNFAMELINVDSFSFCQAVALTKFPISNHPISLIAFQKCNLADSDTVSIRISLFYNNSEIDSGVWIGTSYYINYTQITIPITQSTLLVDTAVIEIKGGNHLTNHQLNMGTAFWVDYLFIDSVPNGIETFKMENSRLNIFPNPVANDLIVDFVNESNSVYSIQLYDYIGNEIIFWGEYKLNNTTLKFSVSFLASGMYYLTLKNEKKILTRKFIKK